VPGFNGTGPQGRGPMTGKGMGFCVMKVPNDKQDQVEGFAGIQGMLVNQYGCAAPGITAGSMHGRGFGRQFGCGYRGSRNRFS
jgi:hypothetical protein